MVANDQKRAMHLHVGGKDIYKISKSITEVAPKTHLTLIAALSAHPEQIANQDYERFVFRQAGQQAEESVDAFHPHLKDLASTCGFHDEREEIQGQIIQGCASAKFRERILEESGKTLADILTLGRPKELSWARAAHMEAALHVPVKTELVNAVTPRPATKPN